VYVNDFIANLNSDGFTGEARKLAIGA
jgi:hypothetical protein